MIIVLDSNEYIQYFERSLEILDEILTNEEISIYINEIIVKETLRNIDEHKKKDFYSLVSRRPFTAYNEKLPLVLLEKFKKLGLKKGDIAIAAFCEHLSADFLVTENRHFLKSRKFEKFEVLSLKGFLKRLR